MEEKRNGRKKRNKVKEEEKRGKEGKRKRGKEGEKEESWRRIIEGKRKKMEGKR